MNQNIKRLFIVLSICLNIGFIIFGSYYYMKERAEAKQQRGFTEKGMHISFYRSLQLSPEQEREIDKLFDDYLKRQSEMKKENKNLRNELISMLAGEEYPDKGNLNRILERIGALKKSREQTTVEHLLKVKAVLAKEQASRMFLLLLSRSEKE